MRLKDVKSWDSFTTLDGKLTQLFTIKKLFFDIWKRALGITDSDVVSSFRSRYEDIDLGFDLGILIEQTATARLGCNANEAKTLVFDMITGINATRKPSIPGNPTKLRLLTDLEAKNRIKVRTTHYEEPRL